MVNTKGGRPRGFVVEEALDAAVRVFWQSGYEGASLERLTGAMGIARPSLYAAFGDKQALFLAAMDRYASTTGSAGIEAFAREPDIVAAVRAFLRTSLENNTRRNAPTGCLLGCCATASTIDVPGVRERLCAVLEGTQAALAARFDQERERGALPSNFPSAERARLLVDQMQGQAFRARSGEGRRRLMAELDARVASVIGPDVHDASH